MRSRRQRMCRSAWRGTARVLAHVLAPPCCALCGGPGQWLDEPWGLDLCVHCEAACPRWQPEPLPFDATLCLFRYGHPVDEMITRLKFHEDLVFARVLGTLLAREVNTRRAELPECLVPLPLHRSRYQERGFCQTTEIARHASRRLRMPDGRQLPVRAGLLCRVRATRAQSGLGAAQRAANLRGAFAVRARGALPRHVALLDDVLTTGHTALAAVAALRAAGIARIELWCCARAPRHDAPQACIPEA
ncbi:MAG TPA: ComF family protein [Steroidobacteraceae bacterium]|nr:ComF family protein [Steroidobacteraceae bacterium]